MSARWRLNGAKCWITNGHEAEVLVVHADTEAGAGSKGITAFLLESGSAGFRPAK